MSPAFQAFLSKTATRRTLLAAVRQASREAAYWQTLRPSLILSVAQGASYWTSVDLLDGDLWGAPIRTALEGFGYASLFVPIFLFYELTEGCSLEEAVERLHRHDQELAMWRLFQ